MALSVADGESRFEPLPFLGDRGRCAALQIQKQGIQRHIQAMGREFCIELPGILTREGNQSCKRGQLLQLLFALRVPDVDDRIFH